MTWQFCMELLRLQPSFFQLKNSTPVFRKKLLFFRNFVSQLKYWKGSKFPVIVTRVLSNGGLFWKSIVLFFRRSVTGFKMKPLKKAFSCVKTKANSNFAVKLAERSNSSVFVYLMNHLFQASVLFNMWQRNL